MILSTKALNQHLSGIENHFSSLLFAVTDIILFSANNSCRPPRLNCLDTPYMQRYGQKKDEKPLKRPFETQKKPLIEVIMIFDACCYDFFEKKIHLLDHITGGACDFFG